MNKEKNKPENNEEQRQKRTASDAFGLFLLGEYEKALNAFDALLKEEPENILFWTNKMICSFYITEPTSSFFDEALKRLDLLPSQGFLCIAQALVFLNKPEEALVFLNKALEKDENNIKACEIKFILLSELDENDALFSFMQSIYPRLKDDEKILCLMAFYAAQHWNLRQARFLLKQALKTNTFLATRNEFFYETLLLTGAEKKAQDISLKTIEDEEENNPVLWRALAEASFSLGDFDAVDEAYQAFELISDLLDEEKLRWAESLIEQEKYEEAFKRLILIKDTTLYEAVFLATRECLIFLKERMTKGTFHSLLEQWKGLKPLDENVNHVVASLAQEDKETSAPFTLTRMLNNAYGLQIAKTALNTKRYCGVSVLENTLNKTKIPLVQSMNILDLGCGACVLVDVLKNYTYPKGKITGVDISSLAIEIAEEKHLYHTLIEMEMTSFLKTTKDTFNLITCIDVLYTFSDLSEIFQNVHPVLADKGFFIFTTLTQEKEMQRPFKLDETGQFYHNENFVLDCLKKTSFKLLFKEMVILRKTDEDENVYADVFVVKKI